MATPSLFSRVIKSQGEDREILSIRDRIQSGTCYEGYAIHTDGSLQYRGGHRMVELKNHPRVVELPWRHERQK